MSNPIITSHNVLRILSGSSSEETEEVASEYPLTIYLNGDEFVTMVCSPDYIEELVIGFLASEGLIHFYKDEVKSLNLDLNQGFAHVELRNRSSINKQFYSKRFIGSCCGKSRQSFYFHNDAKTAKTSYATQKISPIMCANLMISLQNQSAAFKITGGLHNAALCIPERILLSREDIGRHNALDKIYGHCLMQNIPTRDKILAFSGRISSEVLLKAAKIGVGILLSKAAPTDLALRMAHDLNMTTVGFIRGERMNVYTHPERIQTP